MGRRLVATGPTADKFEERHAESVVAESFRPDAGDIQWAESVRSDAANTRQPESLRSDRAWRFVPPTATRPIRQLRATRPRSICPHWRCGAIRTLRRDARRRRGTALAKPRARTLLP